jgi:hypothetical protein
MNNNNIPGLIERLNQEKEEKFRQVPYSERALLLPHCLNEEYKKELKSYSEQLGYKVYILKGGSAIRKIIESEKPKAIVGVACPLEAEMALTRIIPKEMPYQAVLLSTNGCEDTLVDILKAKEKISLK